MTDCLREHDVLDAVAAARLHADADLQRHLGECAACADLAAVATALADEREAARQEAIVAGAEVIWYRAQLRARAEAARLASRPVALVQALTLACAVGALAGVVGTIAWWLRSWAVWLSTAASVVANAPGSLEMAMLAARGALLAIAVWLVIAPVAVYLAATED